MPTLADTFGLAWQHHQAGNYSQAEVLYKEILQADPKHADAWCFLGAACQSQGRITEAEANYRRAAEIMPGFAAAQNHLGILLAQRGRLEEAAACFQQLLEFEPGDADAHNNLGLIRVEQGLLEPAVACYRQALKLRPDFAAARANLTMALERLAAQMGRAAGIQGQGASRQAVGQSAVAAAAAANLRGVALAQQGLFQEAIVQFQEALANNPGDPQAHVNLGTVYDLQNKGEDAIAEFEKVLGITPGHIEAHYNLGVALAKQGKFGEAAACYQQAIRLQPNHLDARHNLAIALMELNRLDEAVDCFRQALTLNPASAGIFNNLANALLKQGRFDEAVRCYRQALSLKPDFAHAYNNLGGALEHQDQLEEAADCYDHALKISPDLIEAWNGLGNTRRQQGSYEEALACFDRALQLDPSSPEGHCNRSIVRILLGNWKEGWPELEWRWKLSIAARYNFHQPLWDGSPLDGRTLLLLAEQGLGDTLQFIRYLPEARMRGAKVIVHCQKALLRFLGGLPGIDQLLPWGATLPHFDAYAPFLSLPAIFRNSPDNVPATVPYLSADPGLVKHWRGELQRVKGFKVGIAWQGSRTYRADHRRSIPLSHFLRLAEVPGVQLISLQVGHGTEQLRGISTGHGDAGSQVMDFGDCIDKEAGAFMDTAAIMKNLDLVISSDTAIPHLAGALAVPVWVALPFVPDWRWLLEREDTPWYPTMRLFRQKSWGNWQEVFERMVAALAEFSGKSKRRGRV